MNDTYNEDRDVFVVEHPDVATLGSEPRTLWVVRHQGRNVATFSSKSRAEQRAREEAQRLNARAWYLMSDKTHCLIPAAG
jgi:hypothetical protein